MRWTRWALCLGWLVAQAGIARASPLSIGRFGGLRGDPMYEGAFALYWDPAALAGPGWDVALDGQLLSRQATYDRDAALNNIPDDQKAANAGLAHVATTGFAPGLAARWGKSVKYVDIGVGLGAFVDTGGAATWDKNLSAPAEFPGAVDGPQRWASISANLLVVDLSVGFAVRHRRSGLSLGVAPLLAVGTFSTTRARNIDRSEDLVDSAGNLKEGRAYFEGSGVGYGVVVGARWDIGPRWAIAATYQRGARLMLTGDLQVAFGTQAPSSQHAVLRLPIADTVRLGASLRVTRRLTLRPSLEFALWSQLKRHVFAAASDGTPLLVIDREFSDTVAGRLRADVRLGDRWKLMFGIGAEKGPTPTRTMEPGFGEGNSLEAGAGAMVALSHHVDLSATFFFHYFIPLTVTDSIQQPPTNGTYTDQRQYVVVSLEVHGWQASLR